ncbi:MAG: hypothetical protein PHP64_04645 [Actinomycetota bacterium]|nr:hypothetical protein [Actinomycetota bacterium]
MNLRDYISQWVGGEVLAFCGQVKFRGVLREILEGDYLVLTDVAIINPASSETVEYAICVLNMGEVSGVAHEEAVGRGGAGEEY